MHPHIITTRKAPFFPDDLVPDETGLVALGGMLNDEILIEAYSKGIFPWSGEDPVPWYSPDPRLVLFPASMHVSRSLEKIIRQRRFYVKADSDFENVINGCAFISRKRQKGTWIDRNIVRAYLKLHELGIAHSIEVYDGGDLCGGLYGLALGNCFFGESMFSKFANASKIALYFLCRILIELNFLFIDCQQVTTHMLRLGAVPIPRTLFLQLLEQGLAVDIPRKRWHFEYPSI
jgi:leucyl/phenylalanyl-tRNA--protein transferase